MGEDVPSEKLGIRIEPPRTDHVGVLYYLLVIVSFAFVCFATWLLYLEWTGEPLPQVLRALIPV
ncbi:MAG: hypothetical protein A3G87_05170 [Omnitrophica bacterium RIFCSPLOWO2_12_FULL_50_11]|nr:MAG: hypothetical protein A3G87_05170 [Omnitrophica bacterium RIFCSPLOWO2_12_FULL_50_11]